ncbi:hypothetical protein RJ639_041422 [Escallonia herrerae]|uniref:RNase H type-1 domain-containing protein n=1 Tax=Escallonia herrerae TaxID=1293975 RepID=A0AA88WIR1_9ASTE|nr:hypothetical protein RJ639_041422 [Escallonia herrerae]
MVVTLPPVIVVSQMMMVVWVVVLVLMGHGIDVHKLGTAATLPSMVVDESANDGPGVGYGGQVGVRGGVLVSFFMDVDVSVKGNIIAARIDGLSIEGDVDIHDTDQTGTLAGLELGDLDFARQDDEDHKDSISEKKPVFLRHYLLRQYKNAQIKAPYPRLMTPVNWQTPLENRYKINFDAARFTRECAIGIGVVVRGNKGDFYAGLSKKIMGSLTPENAEALAASEAVLLGLECGFRNVTIEGDATNIISALL